MKQILKRNTKEIIILSLIMGSIIGAFIFSGFGISMLKKVLSNNENLNITRPSGYYTRSGEQIYTTYDYAMQKTMILLSITGIPIACCLWLGLIKYFEGCY